MSDTQVPDVKKIDRAGLVNVYDTLAQVKTSVDEVTYRFRAASMRKQLEPHVEPIIEMREDVMKKRPVAFDEKRTKLCQDFAARNKDGHPIISNNNYVIDPDRQKEFDAAFATLMAETKPDRDAFEAEVKKVNEWLMEEVDFPSIKGRFPLSAFNKTASQDLLETLFDFIDDDSAPEKAKK